MVVDLGSGSQSGIVGSVGLSFRQRVWQSSVVVHVSAFVQPLAPQVVVPAGQCVMSSGVHVIPMQMRPSRQPVGPLSLEHGSRHRRPPTSSVHWNLLVVLSPRSQSFGVAAMPLVPPVPAVPPVPPVPAAPPAPPVPPV